MTRQSGVLLSLLLAACGSGAGLDPGSTVTPLTLEPPPIYSLLGYRADLGLESDQIVRLDSLANWVRDENAPLVDSLRTLGGDGTQARGAFEIDDAGQALLEEIRANNREAGESAGEVLTEEQRGMVCRLYDQDRETGRRPPPGAPPAEPDSALSARGSRLWPWCGPTPEEDDTAGVALR